MRRSTLLVPGGVVDQREVGVDMGLSMIVRMHRFGRHGLWLLGMLLCLLWGHGHVLASPLHIRFSHVVAPQTPKGLAVERFKQELERLSEGNMLVDVFPSAKLYNDREELQALKLGAVEMLLPSLSKFGRMGFPEFEIFDLPFLFEGQEDVRRLTQGRLGQRLLDRLSKQHMVGLGYLDNGFKQMSANRPLLWPQDYAGLRMRVQSSQVIAAQMDALGATPVVLDFSETTRALAAHVVDGTENPVSNFWTQGMADVQTDLMLSDHAYLGYAVVMGHTFWSKLSSLQRQWVKQALDIALAYGNSIAAHENEQALQALRASGKTRIHRLSSEQRAALRQATALVYEGLARRIGSEWVVAARQSARGK